MSNNSSPSTLLRLAFYALAVALALVHIFVTFRGLSSADGMNQAQLARQIARTNSYQTKVIQPYAWAQMGKAAKTVSPLAMPETTQLPVQPLLWSVAFRIMQPLGSYTPNSGGSPIYFFDRVIACFGVAAWLLTIFLTHGAARRLFDENVAAIAAIALLVCQPGWDLAVSGASRSLMVMLFAMAFRLYASAGARAAEGRSVGLVMVLLGVICGIMVLTHVLAWWIVLGIIIGVAVFLPGGRLGAVIVAAFPVIAFSALAWWNMKLCGDPLGGAKALFQAQSSVIHHSLVMRDWAPALSGLYAHMGYLVPAMLFFTALIHRFRRTEVGAARWMVAVVFGLVAIGMGLIGLSDKDKDDNALYFVLVPAMCVFGSAMLVVLWSRVQSGTQFLSRWGVPLIALLISALPMMVNLPVFMKFGLSMGSKITPHWPPYVPDHAALLHTMVEEDEILFSDAPAFIAWYGDLPCANLPYRRADLAAMQATAQERKARVAGIIITPVSAACERFSDIFTGPYGEWRDIVIRGPMFAFDKDLVLDSSFPFKVINPLIAIPVGSKENLSLPMVFYSDKERRIKRTESP